MRKQASASEQAVFAANRARGAVAFEVHARDGVTRRGRLHESGSLRVRFPSPEGEGLSAVFVNTAGGVAGGDRFDIEIAAGEGSRLALTTAAAEKIYRTTDRPAEFSIALRAEAGAWLAWLPQETILFNGAGLARRIEIDLAQSASLLLCEIAVFGRAAMGERMVSGSLVDRWRVRRAGKLIFAETVRLEGDIGRKLAQPAIGNKAAAIATVLAVPGEQALVDRIREAAGNFGGEAGISAWNGFAMARFCAQDAARLRADVAAVLCRAGSAPLPRLWLSQVVG